MVLLPRHHMNRNTHVRCAHPARGRASGPLGSPPCAELAGRTLCLRSSDGRRRSSTLRTEREGEETPGRRSGLAGSPGRRGQSVRRRTGPLRLTLSRGGTVLGRCRLPRPPGPPSRWQRGASRPPGTPWPWVPACEARGAPPGLGLPSSTRGSLGLLLMTDAD